MNTLTIRITALVVGLGGAGGAYAQSPCDGNSYLHGESCDDSAVTQPIGRAIANAWVPPGRLNIARFGHAATLLQNGKVLVVGAAATTVRNYTIRPPGCGVSPGG